MKRVSGMMGRYVKNHDGVAAIEYAFIAGLISVVIVAAVRALGIEVDGFFDAVAAAFGAE